MRIFFFRKFTKFNLVLHFCHGSLGRRQGAFPLLVKYFSHFENWPFVGWAAGLEQTGGGWWAVMPDGSYQADIMEDVAIWTRTNFSCSNQPTHTWICKKQLCDIKWPTYLMWKILPYKTMDRIKPTLWRMSPFGPGPTSHAATKPTNTSCGFAKIHIN